MRFTSFILIVIACHILSIPSSAFNGEAGGSKSMALGNAFITMKSPWALFTNVAGIARLKSYHAVANYQTRYGINAMDKKSFAFISPLKTGVAGINFLRTGDKLFNKTHAGIGYAHAIGRYSLGLQFSYLQTSFQEYGSVGKFMFNLGGRVTITDYLAFGASIFNINQASYELKEKEFIPTFMNAGLEFQPSKKLILLSSITKSPLNPLQFKSGIEYIMKTKLSIRTGISVKPLINYFGIGYKNEFIEIDYSYGIHHYIGNINNFSIGFILEK